MPLWINVNSQNFQTKCIIRKLRPDNQFQCARFKTCKSYHMHDIRSIYNDYIKNLKP
jgi:hypothetical protein